MTERIEIKVAKLETKVDRIAEDIRGLCTKLDRHLELKERENDRRYAGKWVEHAVKGGIALIPPIIIGIVKYVWDHIPKIK